jgi:head-tail adaptor
MRGGALVYRIAIVEDQLQPNVPDDGGQHVVSVAVVSNEPASVRPRTADERARSVGMFGEATHDVGLRFRPNIRPDMRVTFDDPGEGRTRTFEIKATTADPRRLELNLLCVERQ